MTASFTKCWIDVAKFLKTPPGFPSSLEWTPKGNLLDLNQEKLGKDVWIATSSHSSFAFSYAKTSSLKLEPTTNHGHMSHVTCHRWRRAACVFR